MNSKHISVRAEVADQPILSEEMMDVLSADKFSHPLVALIRQKHLSNYALNQISETTYPMPRLLLANSPHKLPRHALWNLLLDKKEAIRKATLRRTDLPEDLRTAAALNN